MTEHILDEAKRLTEGDGERRKEYGSPLESFQKIASLWSVVLGITVTPQQVALCMLQLKVARELAGHKRDSLVDMAGYVNCLNLIVEELAPQDAVKTTDTPPSCPTCLRPLYAIAHSIDGKATAWRCSYGRCNNSLMYTYTSDGRVIISE